MNPGWRNNYLRYKAYFLNVVGRYKERADILAYLEILLSLVTVSVFSIFALRPTLLTIAHLTREIQSKQQTLKTMEDKIKNLSLAQSLFDRERASIALLESAIPDSPTPEVFARQIEGISAKHGIELAGMSTGAVVLAGKPVDESEEESKTYSFSIQINVPPDQYPVLINFLKDLENLRRPLPFNTASVNVIVGKADENKHLQVTLGGSIPFFLRQ